MGTVRDEQGRYSVKGVCNTPLPSGDFAVHRFFTVSLLFCTKHFLLKKSAFCTTTRYQTPCFLREHTTVLKWSATPRKNNPKRRQTYAGMDHKTWVASRPMCGAIVRNHRSPHSLHTRINGKNMYTRFRLHLTTGLLAWHLPSPTRRRKRNGNLQHRNL